jgi:hypothetical protein
MFVGGYKHTATPEAPGLSKQEREDLARGERSKQTSRRSGQLQEQPSTIRLLPKRSGDACCSIMRACSPVSRA